MITILGVIISKSQLIAIQMWIQQSHFWFFLSTYLSCLDLYFFTAFLYGVYMAFILVVGELLGWSVRKDQKLSHVIQEPVPASSKRGLLLTRADPMSNFGCTSVMKFLRKDTFDSLTPKLAEIILYPMCDFNGFWIRHLWKDNAWAEMILKRGRHT